jgi:hypothetical protein
MFETFKRAATIAFVAAALIARVGFGAFNEKDFSCTDGGVSVDVSGLGNTNLCIEGSATVDLDCACAGNGGNCTSDAKKNTFTDSVDSSLSVAPQNGRVRTTFSLAISVNDSLCTVLGCPGGQTARLVDFSTGGSTFTICTTAAGAGGNCSCDNAPTQGDLPDTLTCGSTSDTPFPGKHNSCANLF